MHSVHKKHDEDPLEDLSDQTELLLRYCAGASQPSCRGVMDTNGGDEERKEEGRNRHDIERLI